MHITRCLLQREPLLLFRAHFTGERRHTLDLSADLQSRTKVSRFTNNVRDRTSKSIILWIDIMRVRIDVDVSSVKFCLEQREALEETRGFHRKRSATSKLTDAAHQRVLDP